ncbi:hypothetical protein AUP42_20255 [Thalassospira lucentensis]|uniref:Uncharacterized protein n=2 Tax=Thalassospira TaxID=168934 RepID=A0A367XB85_9PROT|nr:hypothetical protein AUP42_20255 [Thalassospira lucentensis]MAZ32509.1 hypothetical protein [Thalassospira sp.]RCK50923.1 hypothetical protein TH44_09140 [Thalassospira xiamenensis]
MAEGIRDWRIRAKNFAIFNSTAIKSSDNVTKLFVARLQKGYVAPEIPMSCGVNLINPPD